MKDITMVDQIDKDFTETCSERTIFSDQQGFFGEMFDVVKKCCSDHWLKNTFNVTNCDADKLKLIFDEPDVSDMLLGTLEHVKEVYRKKDSAFSYKRRIEGEKLHQQNDLDNSLLLLTQAILRATSKGLIFYFPL